MEEILRSEAIRDKITRIFRFLQDMYQIRYPVTDNIQNQLWTLWFHELPSHSAIEIGNPVDSHTNDNFILRVQKPVLTTCPEPPAEILTWLQKGWQYPEKDVQVIEKQIKIDENGEETTEYFQDDDRRVKEFETWLKKRNAWAEKERPARVAMRVYEKLYSLYAWIEKENETVDLVLGDGILKWKEVYHPLLLLRVELRFNPSVPEFTIVETEQDPELYSALLRNINEVDSSAISRCIQDLELGLYHPMDGLETEEYFKRVVSQLSPYGQFVQKGEGIKGSENPLLWRDPVIFLRKRSLGYVRAIERILEDLPNRKDMPEAITRIVGIHPKYEKVKQNHLVTLENLDINGEDERILLSKEANAEQLKIALLLEKYGSVLVQGPPGTGKTHTIANLMGHLLAQGKKILVTSHTTKALSVLRDKVAKPLQDLCVSVLDSDNKDLLEKSIDTINERLSTIDTTKEEQMIRKLEEERKKLLQQLKEKRNQLKLARMDEYRLIVVAGKEYHPSVAARFIQKHKGEYDWIPGPVEPGAPLPLSKEELEELYQSNGLIQPDEEKELSFSLPKPEELLNPIEFRELVEKINGLLQTDLKYRTDLWDSTIERSIEDLKILQNELSNVMSVLEEGNYWKFAVIMAGQGDESQRGIWEELITIIETTYQKMLATQKEFLEYDPSLLQDYDLEKAKFVISEIIDYLNSTFAP